MTAPPPHELQDIGSRLTIDTSRVSGRREEDSPIVGPNPNGGMAGGGGVGGGAGPANNGGMAGLAQDSISLGQLKRLVVEGARAMTMGTIEEQVSWLTFAIPPRGNVEEQQPEYAFEYATSDTLPEELSEWFTYSMPDLSLLTGCAKATFEDIYATLSLPPHQSSQSNRGKGRTAKWTTSKDVKRRRFVSRCADLLEHTSQEERVKGLEGISFVVQGVFGELHDEEEEQLYWIKRNVKLVSKVSGVVEGVYSCLRKAVGREWEFAASATQAAANGTESGDSIEARAWNRRELRQALTVLYFLVEVTRQVSDESSTPVGMDEELETLRDDIAHLQGDAGLLGFLVKNISRLRWEDADLPLTNMLLLTWKTILLVFGHTDKHLPKVKQFARVVEGLSPEVDKSLITASPLDYHIFRQDIIAKYPAYDPPKTLFPFEGTNSFLPSLSAHTMSERTGGNHDVLLGGKGGYENLASIVDKAVHIATPAPSPPPSPAGVGGKGGKKQNYQTNQNFPFLYPSSDDGMSDLDRKFGKSWWSDDDDEDSGVPTSIKEAGDLFSRRMRITLAMRQLWKEREAFLKFGRGWEVDDMEENIERRAQKEGRIPRWEEKRLASVEEFYKAALPQMQSFVIVLFKLLLSNIAAQQAPPAPPPPPNSQQVSFAENEEGKDPSVPKSLVTDPPTGDVDPASGSNRSSWNLFSKSKPKDNASLGTIEENEAKSSVDWEKEREKEKQEREAEEKKQWEESDAARLREITPKAITAILVCLLKWFRVSHILKYEYFTQLLLDSNYIPLVLKILNQQDIVANLTAKSDRRERTYFRICNLHSLSPQPLYSDDGMSSADEAVPPPIVRYRGEPTEPTPAAAAGAPNPQTSFLDDSPTSSQPPGMITDFSWRNFFTSVNIMRVLQKIVKGKAHRNLALVQYKSSAILRKPLKCPQTELRLYTLKVFKGQVPYCGRKWRQNNMRVITSIYLYCRPELRDDWLAGGDVDAEVEEALPQEQALRALTHFYNIRRYPQSMGADMKMLEEEQDFFRRELERMELYGVGNGLGGGDENGSNDGNAVDWVEGEGWN